MAGGLRDSAGGIWGLCELLDEHAEAVEFDLLTHGLRLADLGSRFSWRDLWVLARRWASTSGTALSEAMHGHPLWSQDTEFLAAIIDAVQMGNWQRMQRKSAPKPKPVERPGSKASRSTRLGSDPIPMSEFDDWWSSKAG